MLQAYFLGRAWQIGWEDRKGPGVEQGENGAEKGWVELMEAGGSGMEGWLLSGNADKCQIWGTVPLYKNHV